jgi:hypothetical protein
MGEDLIIALDYLMRAAVPHELVKSQTSRIFNNILRGIVDIPQRAHDVTPHTAPAATR